MKKILKWGLTLLVIFAMLFVFAAGCAGDDKENDADEVENGDVGEEEDVEDVDEEEDE